MQPIQPIQTIQSIKPSQPSQSIQIFLNVQINYKQLRLIELLLEFINK